MKREKYVLTVDCGTSNVRSLLFRISDGRHAAVSQRDWYVPEKTDVPGAVDFDGGKNWIMVRECIRQAMRDVDPKDVSAVTASGFRHGILCVDKAGKDVFGCFNMDSRAEGEVKSLVDSGKAPRIYEINGDWPNVQGLPRLIWLRDHRPAVYRSIDKVLLVSDWVVNRLSGVAAMEPGDASSTNLLDIRTRKWSSEIIGMCGLDEGIFPDIVDAGTVVGKVTAEAAAETGLEKGTPVIAGVADTQAGLVGVGALGDGSATIVGGSYWLDCVITDKPYLDAQKRLRTSCHSEKDKWLLEGVGFYVGLAVRWFRDAFGDFEKAIESAYGIDAYYLLEQLARKVPAGSYGLQVTLSDIVNMKYWKHAAPSFVGWDILAPEKSHKGVFFKAILENAAMQACGEYRNIAEITGSFPEKIILSGGAAKSGIWGQIIADVTGAEVVIPVEKEGTALGAAMYAAMSIGEFASTAEAQSAFVRVERVFRPQKANAAVYEKLYKQWRIIYGNGLDLVERGIVKPMWQAAGTLSEAQRNSEFS
jgi:autoinducer 2 (AI-2) kinase